MPRVFRLLISVLALAALAAAPAGTVPARKQGRDVRGSQSARAGAAPAPVRPFRGRPSPEALRWAEARLRRMRPEEKIGQLIAIGVNGRFVNEGSEAYRELSRQVKENHVGGVVLYAAPVYESVHLSNRLQRLARVPLLVSADMEIGAGMRFSDTVSLPWNMAVGATGDPEYARRQGEIIAHEARALGVGQIFGPVADVNNNADNPIINVRAYSEDPAEVARFSSAFIEGAQSRGVMATAKHFPGHGNTAIDSHRGLPVIDADRASLDRVELVPFRAAVATGVGSVMASFIGLPRLDPTVIRPLPPGERDRPAYVAEGDEVVAESATLPAALSPRVMSDLLRRELKFDGLIVTDALDMSGLTIYFRQGEAAVRAVEAGADMLIKPMNADEALRGLREAVRAGRLSRKRIDESVRRILAAKYDLGLARRRETPLAEVDRLLSNPEVDAFARDVARRAITLVRNGDNLVPIKLRPQARIFNLVVTNGEDRQVAAPFVTELSRGGWRVTTAVLDGRSSEEEIRQAMKQARAADLVIASLYGRVRAGQPGSAGLPEPTVRALDDLVKGDAPLVGVSFGNPYLLRRFPRLRTYVVAYGEMPVMQEAAARALLGEADITGRLPITLPSLHRRGDGIALKASARKN